MGTTNHTFISNKYFLVSAFSAHSIASIIISQMYIHNKTLNTFTKLSVVPFMNRDQLSLVYYLFDWHDPVLADILTLYLKFIHCWVDIIIYLIKHGNIEKKFCVMFKHMYMKFKLQLPYILWTWNLDHWQTFEKGHKPCLWIFCVIFRPEMNLRKS